ncbi:hypothetical protein [Dysgonomonas sp. Marseille-P4361]|uniref:hypothetical protein n=1 Tax=Dysgonomonas sp. Marseille-P4361 TaxID=2161820 RepID=UPI000D54CCC6|nr:hypothetical protein [Dysgonomonas sp. Marseille-P4361]
MIKPANLILFAILMLSNLVSVHAQEQNADAQKAILGKWAIADVKTDIVTSDSASTTKIEKFWVALDQAIGTTEETIVGAEFFDDYYINNKGDRYDYTLSGNKMISSKNGEENNVDEVSFEIKGDTLIYFYDLGEKLRDLVKALEDMSEDMEETGVEREFPKGLVIEKCFISVYFSRVKGETEIN